MKPAERLDLIDAIGRELQHRYTFGDIDAYLRAYGISAEPNADRGSKWVYVKQALRPNASDEIVLQIAIDLGLRNAVADSDLTVAPRSWDGAKGKKVFLSHLSRSKDKAHRLKEAFARWEVHLFVAHDDIQPTLQWQREILRALHSMDCFVSLHTPGFMASYWCQQEVGFAVARNVPMVAIRMGEDPVGFPSSNQALSRGTKTADELVREIAELWELDLPF